MKVLALNGSPYMKASSTYHMKNLSEQDIDQIVTAQADDAPPGGWTFLTLAGPILASLKRGPKSKREV